MNNYMKLNELKGELLDELREAFKKYYLDRGIVPISSDTPIIGPVSEHLDREPLYIFLPPCLLMW